MTRAAALVLVVVAACIGALALRAQEATSHRRQEVLEADRAFCRAVADRDVVAFRRLVADSARFFGTDGSVLAGTDDIVRAWTPLMAADRQVELRWEPRTVEIAAAGDLAYTTGDFEKRRVGSAAAPERGRYVTIWRKTDSSWQAVLDIGTRPAAATR